MTLKQIQGSSKYFNAKRISFDLFVLLFAFFLTYFVERGIAPEAKIGFISLFLSKWVFVSAGIIAAHISRKMIFPYIDFNNGADPIKKIFLIVWYAVIIFCFARGG